MSVAAVNERLAALTAAGTSIWLDQLSRGMVASGELARMVEEDSLRGVTSNPAIFEKAMLGTDDYDEALAAAAQEGLSAREVYRRLAVADVQAAADVLRPVYEQTGGLDGYVSLEVAPRLAHDTEGTLEQARLYHGLVDRPNLMVKVPATDAGMPAIEELLFEGVHVNITLLFGVAAYRRVMDAYVAAMERRLDAGRPLDVHSVASFFVSRVDSEVDRRLEEMGRPDLMGRAAVANARAAYRAYREVFHGPRFARLREAGCPGQRPLWASTGVKNPRYDPAMYVLELAGPETVNTMPLSTLRAVAEGGGEAPASSTVDFDPQPDLDAIREAGIDLDEVTDKLLGEGIELFVEAMRKLIDGIEKRREAVITGRPPTIEADLPPDLERPVAERVRRAVQEDVARRIWRRDASLWAPEGTPEVADRLGWLDIAERLHDEAPALAAWARDVCEEGFTDALLLGMGGSSLAPEVFRRSYGTGSGLALHVLDTTEPRTIAEHRERLDPATTLILVSTKSGGTIETLSLFKSFWAWSGGDGSRFVAITDPASGLAGLAAEHGFRRTFLNDPEIGGRYSALSYFGLVPAALAGVDVEGQLHQSEVAEQNCSEWQDSRRNSGLWLGCALGELARAGRDKVTYVVDPPISSFGLWVEQLVAESTGKRGTGALPVADEPLGPPGGYGPDRVFVHLANDDAPDEANARFVAQAARAGHPAFTLRSHGPGDLGRLFFFAEFATAVSGWVLGINPFDQPDVQEAKDNTGRALQGEVPAPPDGSLAEVLDDLEPPAYLALMGYLPYDEATDAAVTRLRDVVLARRGVATTWGYGPRFLHSTGQYHKGGPATGRFLQLVHDGEDDVEIPGESFGFRRLISAQADGDLQTLRDRGRPAARIRLPADRVAAAIDELTARVEGML